jgi:hypothetical protein
MPLEFGEVQIDHNWRYVGLSRSYKLPIIVAKPPSLNGSDPAVIRIRNVSSEGFEIRLQEWDYLDETHSLENVSYLVMERGSYALADGTRVDAGDFNTDKVDNFRSVSFNQSFQKVPVVMSSITSFNGTQAITGRLREITTNGFEYKMQEQEASSDTHANESISYIAWEPSFGSTGGVTYEVSKTGSVVNHNFFTIPFTVTFSDTPTFLADMQTTNGSDTANVRWKTLGRDSVIVHVNEEQSADNEIEHGNEAVGYMLFFEYQ